MSPERHTYAPFSPEEARAISQMIATPGSTMRCPCCGGDLAMSMPLAGGGSVAAVWRIHCDSCRKSTYGRDLPSAKSPHPPVP